MAWGILLLAVAVAKFLAKVRPVCWTSLLIDTWVCMKTAFWACLPRKIRDRLSPVFRAIEPNTSVEPTAIPVIFNNIVMEKQETLLWFLSIERPNNLPVSHKAKRHVKQAQY